MQELIDLQHEASSTATEKGFWDGYDDFNDRVPECIALCHSELSEALEAHRRGNIDGGDGLYEELADTVIRILDLTDKIECENDDGYAMIETMMDKMERNKDREYKHGKNY